jgi:uncharacterized membrane-anchored protein YitT (DUF2179 family)
MKKAIDGAVSLFMISVGAGVFAFGVAAFIRPINAPLGGVSGIAQVISHVSGWPMGVLIIILNIPLFLLSWRELGIRFIAGSLYGMVLFSILIDVLDGHVPVLTENPLLSALYGGVLYGAGLALVYMRGATTGGSDIVVKLIQRRMEHLSMGRVTLIINVMIISGAAVVFQSIESALFAIVVQYVASSVMDAMLHGVDNSSVALIITTDPKSMSDAINADLKRGVTGLSGRGMYTNDDKTVLMVAVRRHELGLLKRIVRAQDNSSFVITLNTNEVLGKGFKHMG